MATRAYHFFLGLLLSPIPLAGSVLHRLVPAAGDLGSRGIQGALVLQGPHGFTEQEVLLSPLKCLWRC